MAFYLIPVFGVATAAVFGDRLGLSQWVGAVIVVVAVAILTIRMAGTQASASRRMDDALIPGGGS